MSRLILVPTPVGNLEDITLRALKVLKEADIILAEDTRNASVLLKHYGIMKKAVPHHSFNEHKTVAGIVRKISEGAVVALTTDAGTPGISDPGFLLVRECIKSGISVECLPGPTALIPAVVVSGLPSNTFVFAGFLPPKKGRNSMIESFASEQRTMVFYESPHRLVKTLQQFCEFFGEKRSACVCRELSKIHEETARGSLGELYARFSNEQVKGEIVIVVAGCSEKIKE